MPNRGKPIILISGTVITPAGDIWPVFKLNQSYITAIALNGGIPIMACTTKLASEYAEIADGLIITGGESVHPRYYGETFTHMADNDAKIIDYISSECNCARDELEFSLFNEFEKRGKPIMGICRGHQLLNAAMGGVNTLNFPRTHPFEHSNGILHIAIIEEDSVLGRLFGTKIMVNSFHRDCVIKTGSKVRITAKSEDGTIEAIEHETKPIYGFQFHPERMRGDTPIPSSGPNTDILFQWFIDQCTQYSLRLN